MAICPSVSWMQNPRARPDLAAQPWRILYLSHVGQLGGAERSLLDLVQCLDRTAFEPIVALPGPSELSGRLRQAGISMCYVPTLKRFRRSGRALFMAHDVYIANRQVRALVRRLGIRLVHANSASAALYATFPRRPDVPVLTHVRDMAGPRMLRHWLARRSDVVLGTSRASVEQWPTACRKFVVPNGIRLEHPAFEEAARRREPSAQDAPVLFAAHAASWKGHVLFLRAARYALQRQPSLRFVMLGDDVFGDHSPTMSQVRAEIRQLGLGERVRLAGVVDDAVPAIARALMLVHPAFPEPFGRVVVEAMAAGRPVIARAGRHGASEALAGYQGGLLVDAATPEAFGEAIVRLATDPALRARLGAAGRLRAQRLYGREVMTRRVQIAYADMLDGG